MDYPAIILYLGVAMITPGPSNLMALYCTATYGLRGAMKYLLGTSTGFSVRMFLCGALNVMLARVIPHIVPYAKWVGAFYMLYLALHMLRDGFSGKKDLAERGGESTFMSGILLQCFNIKAWLASLLVFSTYVIPYTTDAGTIITVAMIGIVAMLISTALWALGGKVIRRAYAVHRKAFSVAMALSLVYCALMALR